MAVTIPGGGGSVITFSVTVPLGAAGSNYAHDFANAVEAATVITTLPVESTVAGALNVFDSGSGGINTILTTGSQYTFVASATSSTITLAASNETLLIGALSTVTELGSVGGERVVFTGGDNLFTGSSTGVGGDTIAAGDGHDTIVTGAGPSTVFGNGDASIYLNDTSTGGGDVVALQGGMSTVYADGVADTVFAGASGVIYGGASEVTVTSAASTTALPVTVIGGTGGALVYGSAGLDVTFSNAAGDAAGVFNAGAGNETLDGGAAAGGFYFFADTASGDAGSVVDSVTGGSGYDFFSTGVGTEDFTAGSGAADFEITSVAGAAITINDFSAGDSVNFGGLSVSDETSLLGTSSTVSGGNLTVTLGNGSTVEFVGVTSLTGHLY